jgi:transketolase
MKKEEFDSHRQSAQVATNLAYDPTELEQSQRDGYADLLANLGDKYPELVVIDADLSTVGKTFGFKDKWPERHLQVGIAEQNMMGVAAGMAQFGMIPICHSLAVFGIGRTFDQIRESICYSELNVKIVGLHAGITLGQDGATHQTMEDIALMASLPNMSVVAPADAHQTRELLPSIIEADSPVYLRLLFPKMTNITANSKTTYGKVQVIKEGSDLTIFSYGQTLHMCLDAANLLEKEGHSVGVINIHTLKPIDTEGVLEQLRVTGKGLVVEEHNMFGGLGSMIASISSEFCPSKLKFINTNDKFGLTGLPEEILESFGFTVDNISNTAIALIEEK